MKKNYTFEQLCEIMQLQPTEILNIYPYGSRVYGCHNEESDHDFIVVFKRSFLPNGAFKDNAKTFAEGKIQATFYSKGGFLDALNNYDSTKCHVLIRFRRI